MFNPKEGNERGTEEQKTHYMQKTKSKVTDVKKTTLIVLNMYL